MSMSVDRSMSFEPVENNVNFPQQEESILKHLNRKWTIRNIFQLKRFMIRDDWNRVTALYSRHHSQHSDIDDRQDT